MSENRRTISIMSKPTTRYATAGLMFAALTVAGPALAAGGGTTHCPPVGIHAKKSGLYPFKNRVAELAWLKTKPNYDYKANEKPLTKMFFIHAYRQTKSNEFKIHDLMNSCVKQIKKAVTNLQTPVAFNLRTKAKVGKYNFKKKAFPLKAYKSSVIFPAPTSITAPAFDTFALKLTNPKLVGMLKMPEKKAEHWIDKRSDVNGNINRTVYLIARVVMTDHFAPRKNGFQWSGPGKRYIMDAKLVHVRVKNSAHGKTLATYNAPGKGQSNS